MAKVRTVGMGKGRHIHRYAGGLDGWSDGGGAAVLSTLHVWHARSGVRESMVMRR